MVTLHARASDGQAPEHLAAAVKRRLAERFDIAHATVEVEFDGCADDAAGAGRSPAG